MSLFRIAENIANASQPQNSTLDEAIDPEWESPITLVTNKYVFMHTSHFVLSRISFIGSHFIAFTSCISFEPVSDRVSLELIIIVSLGVT